jgi:beta-xylosidase
VPRRHCAAAKVSNMSSINPIIGGFAPDPSLILVDGTYFLVNSTFHLFPGLPIYTSQDLVHWKQIGMDCVHSLLLTD